MNILPFTSGKSREFSKYFLHRRTASEFKLQEVNILIGQMILTDKPPPFPFKEFSVSYLPDSQQTF